MRTGRYQLMCLLRIPTGEVAFGRVGVPGPADVAREAAHADIRTGGGAEVCDAEALAGDVRVTAARVGADGGAGVAVVVADAGADAGIRRCGGQARNVVDIREMRRAARVVV